MAGMEMPAMIAVEYRGDLVALVSVRRIHIVAPWLLARPLGDAELRFVAMMCAYGREILAGRIREPFTSDLAEAWARRALIDGERLAELAGRPDAEAARALGVPLRELQIARSDGRFGMRTSAH
jgi:hypothetical protein